MDFFVEANLTDVENTLKDNEEILKNVEVMKQALDCYKIDRFIGVENEKMLETAAMDLNTNGSFLAGKKYSAVRTQKT